MLDRPSPHDVFDLIGNFLYHGETKTVADDEDDLETPVLRPLVWLGNSRRNIQAFPTEAQKTIGFELQLIQFGGMPKDAKPFKGVGSGVFEIALRCRFRSGWGSPAVLMATVPLQAETTENPVKMGTSV